MESTSPQGDFFDYIDIDAIDNKHNVVTEPKHLAVKNAPSRATRLVRKGDILFSMVRPYLRNIARVESDGCIASTGFYVCRCSNAIDSKFCYYLMLSDYVVEGLNQHMKGDNSPSINNNHITSWLYPIPPLAEQRRICDSIDSLFSTVDSFGTEQLLLHDAITLCRTKILDYAIHGKLVPQDPTDEPSIEVLRRINPNFQPSDNLHYDDIPNNWVECALSDVCTEFIVPQRDKPKKFDGDIPWCRIEDIEGKYLNGSLSNRLVSRETIAEMNMRICPVGTVICSCSASIGTQAIVTKPCCTNQTFIGLVCNPKLIHNEYLYYFLSSQKEKFLEIGTGTTIKYISREKFEGYHIPLPPLLEQEHIVERIDYFNSILDGINRSLAP